MGAFRACGSLVNRSSAGAGSSVDGGRFELPSHTRFVVLKQGHAGSLWFHSLLNQQPGVLSYFEFDGCGSGDGDGGGDGESDAKKEAWLSTSIEHVLARGCCEPPACATFGQAAFAPPDATSPSSFAYACMRRELCSGRCPPRPAPGCVAVGLQRKLNSLALRLLQPLFASPKPRPVRLVLLVRDNAVKHAFSELRTRCHSHVANHVQNASMLATTVRVGIPPPILFGRAAMQLESRVEQVSSAMALGRRLGRPTHVIVYERMQLDAALEMERLFGALDLASSFNRSAVASPLLKATSERLSRSLANFSAHERLFSGWPCLHEMLVSAEPRTFPDGCPRLSDAAVAALPEGIVQRAARGVYGGLLSEAKGKAGQIQCVDASQERYLQPINIVRR